MPSYCKNHPERVAKARKMCNTCYGNWLRTPESPYRDNFLASRRRYNAANRALVNRQRRTRQWKRYGFLPEAEAKILELQKGGCGICGTTSNKKQSFHLDHDHTTGRVRGLLCTHCNHALGLLGDGLMDLYRASIYVGFPPARFLYDTKHDYRISN